MRERRRRRRWRKTTSKRREFDIISLNEWAFERTSSLYKSSMGRCCCSQSGSRFHVSSRMCVRVSCTRFFHSEIMWRDTTIRWNVRSINSMGIAFGSLTTYDRVDEKQYFFSLNYSFVPWWSLQPNSEQVTSGKSVSCLFCAASSHHQKHRTAVAKVSSSTWCSLAALMRMKTTHKIEKKIPWKNTSSRVSISTWPKPKREIHLYFRWDISFRSGHYFYTHLNT